MVIAKKLLYNNTHLEYTVQGEGPTVMLVHGFGEDGTIWNVQGSLLSNYKVIIPNLPGSGSAALLPHSSMELLAGALKKIIETEAPGKQTTMLGHSMGGYITLAFAELFPEKLLAFGLVHSSAMADSVEKKETRRKSIEFIKANGAASFLKTMIPTLYAPSTEEAHPEWIEQQIEAAKRFSEETLVQYYEAMIARPDRTLVLKTTHMPVLFLMGRHDKAIPIDDILPQCHMPRVSYIHILEKSGHMGMIEEADETNKVLKEFLSFANGNPT
jgi:pimeloyl-ACP methyl ester carboxylesterase